MSLNVNLFDIGAILELLTPNTDLLYFAQLESKSWYQIPGHMVERFLRSGASVKELVPGEGWKSVERGDTGPAKSEANES